MTSITSPLNMAHQHAANADDYVAQGLLIPAAEEHYKAAEAFLACIETASDENTKRTLRMLYNDHSKAGKELQRRISKLREENKDPSLPQKHTTSTSNTVSIALPLLTPPPPPSPPPHARNQMSDSQQAADESFMLLGQRSDSGDPFNQFWKITEGMLDYLSQPVAFATAPLAPTPQPQNSSHRDASSGSDTDIEAPVSKTMSRGIGLVKAARSRVLAYHSSNTSDSDSIHAAGPSTFPPRPQIIFTGDARDNWDDDVQGYDDDDMADSFCLIPSKSDSLATQLRKENDMFRVDLEDMRKKLASAEGMLKMRQEQDQQLRDSILLARKEAHRAMISSTMAPRQPQSQPQPPTVDLASLNISVSPVPLGPVNPVNPARERESQLVRRVRELEEDVRVLRVENEKQKAMIVRFRERWEKLKESAKRKKQAKAATEATNIVDERIEEDPEAEAEAERNDMRQ
ncbi:uncharacterized protein FIBRA_05006 [Fibroporia radiculosa]|uniref:MIT domain-containing protein n=1 Tax=Fibroporia radiculosa TaxID=599839 RepID=J4HWU9_9APHY|nr:uncharacterized protein FIBRA_05006 [Fibroporia radiculosa]CCM02892.1 predicted protein [Fibroporia radiculosa]